jgi:DNA-directed RNA polymerase subunit L
MEHTISYQLVISVKLNAVEKKKDVLKLEVDGEDHSLLNLLRENAWKKGAKQASYMIKHPYLSKPVVSVRAANPKKVLADSAQMVIDDAKAFEKEFRRASK